jgi:hypothetical protein
MTKDRPALAFRPTRSRIVSLVFLILVGAAAFGLQVTGRLGGVAMAEERTPMEDQWKEIERLVSEQKMQRALEVAGEIRRQAREAGDDDELARALVKEVQLRTSLHGYETSVQFLRAEPWPESSVQRSVIELFYAQSLVHYLHAYSWEIAQRERVVSTAEVDLKQWTRDQLFGEAQQAYARVWAERSAWGAEPVGLLGEYLDQNDFPPRIRGTLRDTVSYLWTELLADSSFWRPEHSNEIFKLDLGTLLALDATRPATDLLDADLHPLVRLSAVLSDLEQWHDAGERPEAAFEARLERIRRLAGSFDSASERTQLREHLRTDLERLGSRFPWWSMGVAQLAELERSDSAHDALVRARETALEGYRAHPESPGGQRCDHIVRSSEAPGYRLDPELVVRRARDYNLLPAHQEVPKLIARQQPDAEWSIELPPTPDYREHRTFVTPPLERRGLWVIVASARSDFRPEANKLAAVNLMVSDLVLVSRPMHQAREVTVRSGARGEALGEVEVELWRFDWRQGHRLVDRGTSRTDGRVRFEQGGDRHGSHFLLARHQGDIALDRTFFSFPKFQDPPTRSGALVFTDRSVYRPQQTIHWKVLGYRGIATGEGMSVVPDAGFTVELLDPNGETVHSAAVETNEFGSASGSFGIPSGRLLGAWSLRTSLGGSSTIRVEEYKRPTFEVEVADPVEALRLNRPAHLAGEARR